MTDQKVEDQPGLRTTSYKLAPKSLFDNPLVLPGIVAVIMLVIALLAML